MARQIGAGDVQRLVQEEGAQLMEVLPQDEYEAEHLPDAIPLSLKALTTETAAVLDRSRPIIVYCWDET